GYDAKTWGPLVKGCTFVNNQSMNATQKVSVTLDLSSTTNLQKQVTTALQAANDTSTSQKVAFLQTASTTSNNFTSVNQAISNLVSTNITDEVKQDLKQLMDNAQNNNLDIEGPVECTKDNPTLASNIQNMLVSQISDTLTKAITGTTVAEAIKSETTIKNTTKTEQKGEGFASVISAVFSGLAGLMTGPVLIIMLIVVVGGIMLFVFRGTISKILEKKTGTSFGRRRAGRSTSYGRRRRY
ncbi:hypothetical protein EBR37_04240, partial [bacterium]|nr:hypothetical protein [bacterium]